MKRVIITASPRRGRPPLLGQKNAEDKEGASGARTLPGDRYVDAQCRITLCDMSTLYRSGHGLWTSPLPVIDGFPAGSFGRAVHGLTQPDDTGGARGADPLTEDDIANANFFLLRLSAPAICGE